MKSKLKLALIFVVTISLVVASLGLGVSAEQNGGTPSEEAFLVVFKSESLPNNYEEMVSQAGGEVTYEVPQIGVIEVTTDQPANFMRQMTANNRVLTVGPSLSVTLDLPELEMAEYEGTESEDIIYNIWESGYQWDIEQVTSNGASHELLSERISDVVVAVIDTGFDFDHPDLAAHVDEEGSKTYVPGTEDSWDNHSHGTHVAGTIGANGRMLGVSPGVTLRSYRVFDTGSAQQIWITNAIVDAADDGVDVINMSLGGTRLLGQWFYTDPETGERIRGGNNAADYVAYNRAIRYAIQNNVTVVASAGNSAQDMSNPSKVTDWQNAGRTDGWEAKGATVFVPAQIPGVITVSSTGGGFGTDNRLAFYSNYGNGAINLGAPGGDLGPEGVNESKYLVLSAVPTYLEYGGRGPEAEALFGKGYGWKGGTSMAAPQVSGAAAAYIAKVLEETGKKPNPRQVQNALQQTAEKVETNGYSRYYGHGIVNAYNVLAR